ncbi:MAG: NAD(P)-dependent glycerol-3-phosphate dehydrogenase [Oscillospiraceae bacterium]|nr:NAD(P)-dependent glycerol-3-phosphate dehydrogenase [Oscillospiraceae bacterium]
MGEKICIIGAGAWGTAISKLLSDNGHDVTVWCRRASQAEELSRLHENRERFPGVPLPENIKYTGDIGSALAGSDIAVFVVASPYIRTMAEKAAPYIESRCTVVNCIKGIEDSSLKLMSQVLEEVLGRDDIVCLSGPSHAEEVVIGMPTAAVAASKSKEAAEYIQNVFMSEVFRVYTSPDITGVELGAALKNVIAIAAGMEDGIGYGDNIKAAIITRGIHEIVRLGKEMGAYPDTLFGLSGIGDLIVTCESRHSRNRTAGYLIGKGYKLPQVLEEVGQTVEGVNSAKAAKMLADRYGVEMPIVEQMNEVLFKGKEPMEAGKDLMHRGKRQESSALKW